MFFSLFTFILLLADFCRAEDNPCPRVQLTLLYDELGCTPVFENNSTCPTRYDCPPGKKDGKCYYRGVGYKVGDEIPENLSLSSCSAACRCLSFDSSSEPTIHCASIECPEFFGPGLNSSCHRMYNPDQCCSEGVSCDETTACTYEGKTYPLGAKFESAAVPCQQCFCQSSGVVCKDIRCDVEIHGASNLRSSCLPVYYKNDACCPVEWKCPDEEYKIIPGVEKSPKTTQGKCIFGKMELAQGDLIEKKSGKDNSECKCIVPPFLTCVHKSS